jgi:hypothetical protein
MTKFKLSDIPDTDTEIEKWLRERWYAKDKRIERFTKDGCFKQE